MTPDSPEATYQRLSTALSGHQLPAAFVDLSALAANMQTVVERAGGKPVRVASKSLRCEAVLRRVLDSGTGFQGVMCFTAAEAAWLYSRGFDDLLVAYPSADSQGIDAACACVAAGARIILTVDSVEHLALLARHARQAGVQLPVSIAVDMSLRLPGLNFGVWRSPLRTAAALVALAQQVDNDNDLELAAVMGYEAQLSGLPDSVPGQPFKNQIVRLLKRWSMRVARQRRSAMLGALHEADLLPGVVNAGGTGCLTFSAAGERVTEVTCGSGLYNPWLFDCYADFRLVPAAGFAVPVVRRPAADRVTCLGGGYTASGAGALPQPWLPAGSRLSSTEGAGEVQTPVLGARVAGLGLGEPVFFRHAKAGELCERFNSLLLIDGERVVDEVLTYRGAGQCFL